MNTLPCEIILVINNYLKTKDFVAFSSCDRVLNQASKIGPVWKTRAFLDYKVLLPNTPSRFKSRYIWCYSNLCIYCSKKTKVFHPLKKVKICGECQETRTEYTMITKSRAKKELYLTGRDFRYAPYCEKINPWNKSRPIKFFLKEDLLNNFRARFPSKEEEEEYKKKKISQRFTRQMLYFARLYVLKSTLLVRFDIDITQFTNFLNSYTKGKFRLFILNISKEQNIELANDLINLIRELDFLYKTNYPLDDLNCDDFENLAKNILIHSRAESTLTNDSYVLQRLNDVKQKHRDVFERKEKLVSYLQGLSYSLYDFDIIVYIIKGTVDLEELRLDYIEQEFVINNLDFLSLNQDTLVSRKSKKEIYIDYISRWVAEGNKVPEELVGRYTVSD